MSFKSRQCYWEFCREVTQGSRSIHSEAVKDFLSNVLKTSQDRVEPVSSGSIFWRAQEGSDEKPVFLDDERVRYDPIPFPNERMKPLQEQASEGRVNPEGIPCLYLATDEKTAMAEVRPWLRSRISVGKFETVKELKLIDCSKHSSRAYAHYEGEPGEEITAVWASIDSAFSRPVARSDKSSDYVPTQILAERFKSNGFDGILYKSALTTDGFNLALFDIDAATMVDGCVYIVEKIQFEFGGPLQNPDFLKNDENPSSS